jgi:hypothetical protein
MEYIRGQAFPEEGEEVEEGEEEENIDSTNEQILHLKRFHPQTIRIPLSNKCH